MLMRWLVGLSSMLVVLSSTAPSPLLAADDEEDRAPLSSANAQCLGCHADETPGIINQWKQSRHAQVGVGCRDCHGAKAGEVDAYEHHSKKRR